MTLCKYAFKSNTFLLPFKEGSKSSLGAHSLVYKKHTAEPTRRKKQKGRLLKEISPT